MNTSRRSFLKQVSAISAVPFILPSNIWAAKNKPNNRIGMGFIGMGKQSRGLLEGFMHHEVCRVVAVCDVDTTRRTAAQQRVNEFYTERPEWGSPDCAAYNDFRELIARDDIDAVCIATPDHWHTIPVLAAVRAGMDVYCEKPLTHNIHESVAVIKAVKKHKAVLQTGSMQRSMKEFRVACELVRNGAIGKIDRVECSFGPPGIPCDLPEEKMEPGLDWNMWIGPGPMRPYNSVLSPRGLHDHFPNWRSYKEYGGGMVCDWGAHHLDIAQWG
ncbi:MAG: Gfo/Idh/MocA family oxidoreductase, partial [Nitrospiraceae bacterium]|nr:Gfo/Idh/MocA family oxidoreductase [Nitrospiraceae bacterium]